MFYWRITKYDPKNRNLDGIYLKDEWTRYSDIGKTFEGNIVTQDEYLKFEASYIKAVLLLMDCLQVEVLQVAGLEKVMKNPKAVYIGDTVIKNNEFYPKETIPLILQSILRNKFWCRLISNNLLYIQTGWDYYMYVGSARACKSTIQKIELMGLFVEKSERAFLFDDED